MTASPHDIYRQEFLARILAEKPASFLDVGCGDGTLLKAVAAAGSARVAGIEPGPKLAAAQATGLDVQSGQAEALPFADDSFDVVAFQYVTHHLADMQKGLREALRVARQAVLILDGWYDTTIPSQRVARDFDEWAKAVDRSTGMIHNSCPKPRELGDIFAGSGLARIDYSCRLVLVPLDLARIEADARKQMGDAKAGPEAAAQWERILGEARHYGMSDDGAILFRALLSR